MLALEIPAEPNEQNHHADPQKRRAERLAHLPQPMGDIAAAGIRGRDVEAEPGDGDRRQQNAQEREGRGGW